MKILGFGREYSDDDRLISAPDKKIQSYYPSLSLSLCGSYILINFCSFIRLLAGNLIGLEGGFNGDFQRLNCKIEKRNHEISDIKYSHSWDGRRARNC